MRTIVLIIAIAAGISMASCKKDIELVNEYYIQGYFNGEFVNYSMDTAYYYTTSHVLGLTAIDDFHESSDYFSLSFGSSQKPFNIDNIILPYTITNERNDVLGILEFIRDAAALTDPADSVNYFGIFGTSYPNNFTITIEKIENDIIEGKFSGEVKTSYEPMKSMSVTGGKFRARFERVSFIPWYYNTKSATQK